MHAKDLGAYGKNLVSSPFDGAAFIRLMEPSMRNVIYRCPTIGFNVQGSAEISDGESLTYVGQRCPACGSLHLVNPRNGKLLAEEFALSTPRQKG
jgi:hypothetical protein